MSLKENIINASLKLFSVKGFTSTSMTDIISAAKTSKGGLYNHFKSKDDLFFAALSEARSLWREKNLYELEEIADPVGKIVQLFRNYQNRYLTDQDLVGGCVFVNLTVELNDQRPDLAEEVNEGFVRLKIMVRRFLEQAKRKQLLKPDTDVNAITAMLIAGLLGACVMYTSDKSEENLEVTISALIMQLEFLRV